MYPIKFTPIYKERIWGGRALESSLGKRLPKGSGELIGESWELSGVEGDVSVVGSGQLRGNSLSELVEVYMDDLVGASVFERYGEEFPLLIKFIDAQDNLSIQVHPDDELAKSRHGAYGKTEMWHIISAESGAKIYLGFNQEVDKAKYMQYLKEQRLEELLLAHEVKPGETYFIPAGAIHAIGSGIVLAEIQQTSDITYRVYDFNRVDGEGKRRELHTELALDAIDYSKGGDFNVTKSGVENQEVVLQRCDYFSSSIIELQGSMDIDLSARDSFTIFICTEGEGVITVEDGHKTEICCGDTVLIPAVVDSIEIEGSANLLSCWVD